MNPRNRLWSTITGILLLPLLGAGCASTRQPAQALVCPQCREVAFDRFPRAIRPEEELSYLYWEEGAQIVHSCPNCQGAITTLFKEGRLRHTCSICDQSPFSCPVDHR